MDLEADLPEVPRMRPLLSSIEAEYRRYKALAEGAIGQLATPT